LDRVEEEVKAMRVIAGTAKGRKLVVPKGETTRPTSDSLREALFNILGKEVVGAAFLDLFAGSGAVGVEALSRGANLVTFVEKSWAGFKALQENLKRAGLEGRVEVVFADVLRFLKDPRVHRSYDLIFLDPPYQSFLVGEVLNLLGQGGWLTPHGIVVVECFHKQLLPPEAGTLKLTREVRHGQTKLVFYKT